MIRAIIADDEAVMRDQLRSRLTLTWPELIIVAEADNGISAIALAHQHQPHIIFLDIRMPGHSGLEAARALQHQCHIIFVTAYDQYAVQAFDQGAVDYLLKPVTQERLQITCDRLQAKLGDAPDSIEHLLARLEQVHHQPAQYLRWIQASVGTSLRMISARDILFFQAEDKYTRVQTEHTQVLIRKPLKELVLELDPNEFWRIHRATLVRVEAIAEITRDGASKLYVRLHKYAQLLEVSRAHTHLFQQM